MDPELFSFLLSATFTAGIFSLYGTFESPKVMYWVGLVSLYIQSLLWVFSFNAVFVAFTKDGNVAGWATGQTIALICSTVPFLLPAALAWITASVAENPMLGVASFTFYSIIQVVVHGVVSGQENFTNRLLTGAKLALPVLSFLISVVRTLAG